MSHTDPSQNEDLVATSEPTPQDELDEATEELTHNLIAELERERDELKDQLLRSLADLQNFRKRAAAEREDTRRYATEQLVRELLPVLDNFERTLAAAEAGADLAAVVEGVKLVERQLRMALESARVSRIQALGMPFDPERHEAIGTVPDSDEPDGTVVDEIEAGYQMAERVVRPARVRVARKA